VVSCLYISHTLHTSAHEIAATAAAAIEIVGWGGGGGDSDGLGGGDRERGGKGDRDGEGVGVEVGVLNRGYGNVGDGGAQAMWWRDMFASRELWDAIEYDTWNGTYPHLDFLTADERPGDPARLEALQRKEVIYLYMYTYIYTCIHL